MIGWMTTHFSVAVCHAAHMHTWNNDCAYCFDVWLYTLVQSLSGVTSRPEERNPKQISNQEWKPQPCTRYLQPKHNGSYVYFALGNVRHGFLHTKA